VSPSPRRFAVFTVPGAALAIVLRGTGPGAALYKNILVRTKQFCQS
jgi:hypothetical protein